MATNKNATRTSRNEAHIASVQVSIRDILERLTGALGKGLLAEIVGKDSRTVSRWLEPGAPALSAESDKIVRNTYQVFAYLTKANDDHTVRAWFMGMNPQLEDQAPAEALAEGQFKETMAAARAFASGG